MLFTYIIGIMSKNYSLSVKRRIYRKICFLLGKYLPDKLYIKMMYQVKLGKKCNLTNPQSFNEKLNYLKLYDRRPEYTVMADKFLVRTYVSEMIGEDYLIPLIGVWDSFNDINFEELPNEFVLKCTHDSASVFICKDKRRLNVNEVKDKISKALQINYFYPSREWPYKNIVPRIIAEKYMVDESGSELKDYKIYCFNGIPKLIQVDFGRFTKHERNLYDVNWNIIDKQIEYPKNLCVKIDKPIKLKDMLEKASVLSKGIPSVRVDFYSINDKVYFGEMTFYQEGGFAKFEPEEFEYELGKEIVLG